MPGEMPLFDRLEVLDDPSPHDAAFNMAADEVLLEGMEGVPLLRLYRWQRPSLSFGYFTPYAAVAEHEASRDLVRRWTGGGVVEHGGDLTYSLLVPRSHPLTNGSMGTSYHLIHDAVRQALCRAGFGETRFAPEVQSVPDAAARGCFEHPVHHDLLCGGHKIGGAAQRRTRRGLLHQGSILLPGCGSSVLETVAEALPLTLGRRLAACSTQGLEPSIRELAREKYSVQAWTRRV